MPSSGAVEQDILNAVANKNDNIIHDLLEKSIDEPASLFIDGFEGYFDQNKQRITGGGTPFSRAPKIDFSEFVENLKLEPPKLSEINESLEEQNRLSFDQWILELEMGYNLCLYGVGSKRRTVMDFLDYWCPEDPIIVVNAYNPAVEYKDLINTCVSNIVPDEVSQTWLKASNERTMAFLRYLEENPPARLVLVVQHIDGASLRSERDQDYLSRLVSSPQIRFLATTETIQAPLLWTRHQESLLGFVWHNVTTFQIAKQEIAYVDVFELGKSRAKVGYHEVPNVLASLTKNAKKLYALLVRSQYNRMAAAKVDTLAMGTPQFGISFPDLFRECLDNFITSSETNLKVMMAEFFDHKMADKTKGKDGVEIIFIPYAFDDLKNLLKEFKK